MALVFHPGLPVVIFVSLETENSGCAFALRAAQGHLLSVTVADALYEVQTYTPPPLLSVKPSGAMRPF
jgi:hypothetical protein